VRRPQGYAVVVDPGGKTREFDTLKCWHCQRILFVKPKQDPATMGGFCRNCMQHICGPCADKGVCAPFMKQIEESEERDRRRREVGSW
jgi:hypothetical protein